MKTAVIKGYIYWRKTVYVYDEANAFQFYPFDMDGWSEKENDALEAAEEAYRASPTYRQDMRNAAVARGA